MSEQDQVSVGEVAARTGERSPNYPALTLAQAVDRLRVIWDHERKNFAPVSSIYSHWGYSPTSSGARQALAALNAFGLLEFRGSGESREAKLSERGLDIVLGDDRHNALALAQAALAPRLYRELVEQYPEGLPSNETLARNLVRHRNMNTNTVERFIEDFRATLAYAKADPGRMPDQQPVQKSSESDPWNRNSSMDATNATPAATPQGFKAETFALDRGEISVRWPATLSPAEFQDIEDWLEILKRKIKRGVAEPSGGSTPT